MDVEKLEEKARKIFEEQGFSVSSDRDVFVAEKDEVSKRYRCISSEEFEKEELEDLDLVFVDEELADLEVDCEVSVLREDEDRDVEMPSYELIGEIAVINELVDFSEEEAVERITSQHPNVKTVLLKTEPLQGEFRVGEYRKLYGTETETVHKEFGCRFRVDPTKVYYSERFSTERDRVVSQIQDGERVLVMFAGIGPYAVMAAKNANPSEVVAVEKNPEAVDYLKENIELNGVEQTVVPVKGDVEEVLPELGKFDRIVMPLPESAINYLGLALENLSQRGTVHLYSFVLDGSWEELEKSVEEVADMENRSLDGIEFTECGDRSPSETRVCADIRF